MLRKISKFWKFVGFISFWIFIQIGVLFASCPDDPEENEICEGDIVITEFFFQPTGNIYEYIELYNTTSATINLMGW